MPVFFKKTSLYFITNYKVMYSKLRHQKNLERITIKNKI